LEEKELWGNYFEDFEPGKLFKHYPDEKALL